MATETVKWKINIARNECLLLTEVLVSKSHYAVLQWWKEQTWGASKALPDRSPAPGTWDWQELAPSITAVCGSFPCCSGRAAQSLREGLRQTTPGTDSAHQSSLWEIQVDQVKGNN